MKKIFLSTILLAMFSAMASAQYYYIPFLNADHNPGSLNNDAEQPAQAGWTSIEATAASPAWSPITNIPFSFNLGSNVFTSFKASTSGVVTFTTAAAAVPASTSAALPDASIPDNSICVWGLAGTGANDAIETKTFGTAPNRQFWIQYTSYSCTGSTGWTYWSVVLEESTNNVYLVDQRNYAAPIALSLGIQLNSTTAYSVAGSPNVTSTTTNGGNQADPLDNSYYEFIYGTQAASSIGFTSLTPTAGSTNSYGLNGANVTIGGTIMNLGSSPITSFTVKYTDGSNTWSDVKTCNVATGGFYSFTHNTPYTIPSVANHNITAWVEMANDAVLTDDTLSTIVVGAAFQPTHQVVIEEGTGTWCGWCPRGAVFMDSMQGAHPSNDVSLVAVHNADPMTVTNYDAGVSAMISGYPSILVDRKEVLDPSQVFDGYTAHLPDFAFADLTMTPTFNGTSVDVVTTTHTAVDLNGNYRLALVVTEDDVTGTGSSWDQHDYYSFQSNNLPLVGAGHNWQTEPNPVPAADMKYDHVARVIVGGFTGQASSLPASMTAGNTYNYTFSNVNLAGWNKNNLRIILMLIDATHDIILNSKSVSYVTGIQEPVVSSLGSLRIYPTVVNDQAHIQVNLNQAGNFCIQVTDLFGHVVSQTTQNESAGLHSYLFNTSDLSNGVYMISVISNQGTLTGKIIKSN